MTDPTGPPPRTLLGVGGGIAAYKVADLLRRLTEAGHDVTVVPTEAALRFVGVATWEALSGRPVATDVWSGTAEVRHVRVGREADLVVVAPATADLMARAAAGMADDLLTASLLTARCPVLWFPAMHTEMWEHPATRANVAVLRERGGVVCEPAVGRLTGPDSGRGRLPEPAEMAALVDVVRHGGAAALRPDLAGLRVVVSAGGTREPLDPVRFLGNRSSGRQGRALALVAAARGASVTLVAANVPGPAPLGVSVVRVGTAREVEAAVGEAATRADVVVMAAAVADFRPDGTPDHKWKRESGAPRVDLVENPDVLAGLVARRARGDLSERLLLVGFAAETGDARRSVLELGREKLARKGCDLLVVNPVGVDRGFETAHNEAVILAADGGETAIPSGSKELVAARIWDRVGAAAARS